MGKIGRSWKKIFNQMLWSLYIALGCKTANTLFCSPFLNRKKYGRYSNTQRFVFYRPIIWSEQQKFVFGLLNTTRAFWWFFDFKCSLKITKWRETVPLIFMYSLCCEWLWLSNLIAIQCRVWVQYNSLYGPNIFTFWVNLDRW